MVTALSPREDSGRLLRVRLNPFSSGNPPSRDFKSSKFPQPKGPEFLRRVDL